MNPLELNTQNGSLQWQNNLEQSKLERLQRDYLNPADTDRKKLKQAAQELEAVFIQQLLDAMDKTVNREDGILSGGSSESYFRGMLNQEVAKSMATRTGGSGFGLAETIYRQAARQLPTENQSSEVKE